MKKFLKALLIVLLAVVLLAAALILWLTVTEYKPADVETLEVNTLSQTLSAVDSSQTISVLSWNIGYAGLGAESDFFMDGGSDVKSADEATVQRYLSGIKSTVESSGSDIIMLQEVDTDSTRTYNIDESAYLALDTGVHALNYSCSFVPYPVPPMGKIHSGLFTTTAGLEIDEAERISLPCPFSWPTRVANLKRCMLASYLPIEGSDKQLVIVNLHLEAYDSGEGKIAQTKVLKEFIEGEYAKGNYVIAGGDFNQIFPGGLEAFPNEHPDLWTPGILEDDMLSDGWQFAYDLSTPSCRLLNQPYDPSDTENTQYYVIDGFILSPNVELLDVSGLNLGFENSDHNPVQISVNLK
jgi:endonuclease/exonuclease/phosphatase family metal-dependent hydrolase